MEIKIIIHFYNMIGRSLVLHHTVLDLIPASPAF